MEEKVKSKKKIIGDAEYVCLPEFGIREISARIDTGAKTSSLHAENIKYFVKNGKDFVRFDIIAKNRKGVLLSRTVETELHMKRRIKTHFDTGRHRPFIITKLKFGDKIFKAVVNLTNRKNMKYKLLIGREVLNKRFLVDVSKSYTLLLK